MTAGVVGGQSLIQSAKVSSQVAQFSQLDTAINAFKLEYDALPGDMKNATEYWGSAASCFDTQITSTATCNGNGDGDLQDPLYDSGIARYEWIIIWQHLHNAKLTNSVILNKSIQGYTAPILKAKLNDEALIGFMAYPSSLSLNPIFSTGGAFTLGDENGEDLIPLGLFIKPKTAYAIDSKIDDGLPINGKVSVITELDDASTCINTTPNPDTYLLTTSANVCSLIIKASF